MKRHTLAWIVGGILCVISCTAALGLSSLQQAHGVAHEIIVTTNSDATTVTNLSRNGAPTPMTQSAPTIWSTQEWSSGLVFSNHDAGDMATVTIDDRDHVFTLPANQYTISSSLLKSHQSALPYFTSLINWPGDGTAIIKSITPHLIVIIGVIIAYIAAYRFLPPLLQPTSLPITHEQAYWVYFICAGTLAFIAWLSFILQSPTAYEWPALDMGPYLTRANDSGALLSDFYTNASLSPNPRHIFGSMITSLSTLLTISWYDSFFFIKCVLVLWLPLAALFALTSWTQLLRPAEKIRFTVIITIGIALCHIPQFLGIWTFALWYPFQTMVTPQVISLASIFTAIACLNYQHRFAGMSMWVFATLMHPPLSICGFIFYSILPHLLSWRSYAATAAAIAIPSLIIQQLYSSTTNLPGELFIYLYIESNHWFHYLPSQFESNPLSPFPWYVHFGLIISILVAQWHLAKKISDASIQKTTFYAGFSLIAAVGVSYIGLELLNSTLIAQIGPARFFIFGYWLLLFTTASLVVHIPLHLPLVSRISSAIPKNKLPYYALYSTMLSLLIIGSYNHFKDDPVANWQLQHKELNTWISTTATSSVFATNVADLMINIPLAANRATFSSAGFPFQPDTWQEFHERKSFLFGAPSDWERIPTGTNHIKMNDYYHQLSITDWCNHPPQYPLDYIIFTTPHLHPSFAAATPIFAHQGITIYDTTSLCDTL